MLTLKLEQCISRHTVERLVSLLEASWLLNQQNSLKGRWSLTEKLNTKSHWEPVSISWTSWMSPGESVWSFWRSSGIDPQRWYELSLELVHCDKSRKGGCCHSQDVVVFHVHIQLLHITGTSLDKHGKWHHWAPKTSQNVWSKLPYVCLVICYKDYLIFAIPLGCQVARW